MKKDVVLMKREGDARKRMAEKRRGGRRGRKGHASMREEAAARYARAHEDETPGEARSERQKGIACEKVKHEGRHKRQEGSGLAKVCKRKRACRAC